MEHNIMRILLFCTALSLQPYNIKAKYYPGTAEDKFCGSNNVCCQNRNDDCSHAIKGGDWRQDTKCYCDKHCKSYKDHDDCCPDYKDVCEETYTSKYRQCTHMGHTYDVGAIRRDNCNKCTCIQDRDNPNNVKWNCDNYLCLIRDDVIYGINQPGSTWKAYNYSQFYGKTFHRAKRFKLGTMQLPSNRTRIISHNKDIPYPERFDCRARWPGFISPVIDQGWCGADWAISTASILSDRLAILSNGAEITLISAQNLLSCSERPDHRGCDGGHIDNAWNYVRNKGLVNEECFPYKGHNIDCPFKKNNTLIQEGCQPTIPQRVYKYTADLIGRLILEEDIMYDILANGPVQAIMTVYQDFFHYRSGIYRHSRYGSQNPMGLHSVRIVGWGEDSLHSDNKYWVVANSWGQEWGEGGYFKIVRGENESDIESFVVTVKPFIVIKKESDFFFIKK